MAHPRLTIRVDRLAVRRPDAKDNSDQDVLETRDEEQRRVLVVECLELFVVDVRLGVPGVHGVGQRRDIIATTMSCLPGLPSDPDEHKHLDRKVDDGLTDDAGQHLL